MSDAISIVKTSMLADLERLNTYGQNFANANTAGYKRQLPLNIDFVRLMDSGMPQNYGSSGLTFSTTDFSAGALTNTGRSLDVAVQGDGFIAVNTDSGLRYTRRGDLTIDGQGRLVAHSGDPVAGAGGDIHLRSEDVKISDTGAISSGDQSLGQLQLVNFDDASKLVYEGNGLFSAEHASIADSRVPPRLIQGFLEAANGKPAQDMLGLMAASRHFELIHNAATAYDQMLDAAINDISSS